MPQIPIYSRYLPLKLTQQQYDALAADAQDRGVTVSALARERISKKTLDNEDIPEYIAVYMKQQINIKLSGRQRKQLRALARAHSKGISAYIRDIIKREYKLDSALARPEEPAKGE